MYISPRVRCTVGCYTYLCVRACVRVYACIPRVRYTVGCYTYLCVCGCVHVYACIIRGSMLTLFCARAISTHISPCDRFLPNAGEQQTSSRPSSTQTTRPSSTQVTCMIEVWLEARTWGGPCMHVRRESVLLPVPARAARRRTRGSRRADCVERTQRVAPCRERVKC